MEKDYENRMVSGSHIRDVGPHSHEWVTVGNDSRGDMYQECSACGTRRVRTTTPGTISELQEWLDGGEWSDVLGVRAVPEKKAKAAKADRVDADDEDDDEPSDSAVRRMSKPDLMAYGRELGLDFDGLDMGREDMIEAILKHR